MNIRSSFTRSARLLSDTRALTTAAMLIALNVALSSVRVQITPELRLSIGFITQAVAGMLLGPVMAMLTGAAGDVISFLCFPSGYFFPGYTLTAVAGGALYGIMLFGRPRVNYIRALLTKALVTLICNILLNTFWLTLTSGGAMAALLPARLIKNACLLPLEALMIYMAASALAVIGKRVKIAGRTKE